MTPAATRDEGERDAVMQTLCCKGPCRAIKRKCGKDVWGPEAAAILAAGYSRRTEATPEARETRERLWKAMCVMGWEKDGTRCDRICMECLEMCGHIMPVVITAITEAVRAATAGLRADLETAKAESLANHELARAAEERATRAERERDAWIETARQHAKNEDFYRDLVVQIGDMFGKEAYISDDGSVQQDVLALKVPELVRALRGQSTEGRA